MVCGVVRYFTQIPLCSSVNFALIQKWMTARGSRGGARMAQLLEALTTDPRVRGSSPWHDQTFKQSEESRQLSVIPGMGITRCGHIERKD